ncbi:hypothetical protein F5Y10DRAFT_228991 [Nemania abortiva]|nr:hypothetical protein F5Y10DRAFT_228991 [Nemania abortiva]
MQDTYNIKRGGAFQPSFTRREDLGLPTRLQASGRTVGVHMNLHHDDLSFWVSGLFRSGLYYIFLVCSFFVFLPDPCLRFSCLWISIYIDFLFIKRSRLLSYSFSAF